jgi:DNA-binding MarR family transcriptional regulator
MNTASIEGESEEQILLHRHAVVALMKAADGARRTMTRALQPYDLTLPQFNVLTVLRHHDELPTFQVAARMVEATPGITRLATTLEAKGYIRRSQSRGDRRQQLCSLTSRGRRVVEAALPDFAAAQKDLVAELSAAETVQITALLQRVPPSRHASGGDDPALRRRSHRR